MGNRIHPTALIDSGVELGDGNTVEAYVVIVAPCTIGDGNWLGPHATLGTPAQIRRGGDELVTTGPGARGVRIGDGNVVREYVSVHQGDGATTTVGNGCYLMTGSNVPHDGHIDDGVTLSAGVQMGGHTVVHAGANLGMSAVVHQFSTVGRLAMVGMHAAVSRDIPPYALVRGVPARIRDVNRVALERAGYDHDVIDALADHLLRARPLAPGLPPEIVAAFEAFEQASRRARATT